MVIMALKWFLIFLSSSLLVSAADDCSLDPIESGKFQICGTRFSTVVIGDNTSISLYANHVPDDVKIKWIELQVIVKHEGIVQLYDDYINISVSNNATVQRSQLVVEGIGAGRTEISFNYTNSAEYIEEPIEKLEHLVRVVAIVHWKPLNIIIAVIGWMYFAAWSVSFYPQIILNFYRRSVVGLNFDFLALNLTGFLAYSAFNLGLYWIPEIEKEYFDKNPGGVNPVQLNDVIFALHATVATVFTIFQCFIFKRNKQRVSIPGGIIIAILWLIMIITLFVSVGGKYSWLNFLYLVSYVKLAVTLIKYVPQAWMNFRRKSTVGWSIGNVLLDFTGGVLSILQMLLISYNYNDWKSIFGDPTKFGLGLFSICFDLLFMTQHYILYRHPRASKDGYSKIGETKPLIGDESQEGHQPDDWISRLSNRMNDKMNEIWIKLRLKSSNGSYEEPK